MGISNHRVSIRVRVRVGLRVEDRVRHVTKKLLKFKQQSKEKNGGGGNYLLTTWSSANHEPTISVNKVKRHDA